MNFSSNPAKAYDNAGDLYVDANREKNPVIAKLYREAAEYQVKRAEGLTAKLPEYLTELYDDISDKIRELVNYLEYAEKAKDTGSTEAEEMYQKAAAITQDEVTALIDRLPADS